MEGGCLQSSAITTIPTSLTKCGFIEKSYIHGQLLKFPHFNKFPHSRKLKILDIKAQASVAAKFRSGAVEADSKEVETKDENLAFVAGATGRVGSRAVRELLKLGFRVRAGVRSAQKAEALVQSVMAIKLDVEGSQPVERLEIVECDLEKPNQIGPALGNASVLLCCIGAGEKEVFDVTGPCRIDYLATKNLVDAATAAKVNHFIMVSSLGTNKVGFPAAILNLFWGVLIWKRKAEEALIASGVPYTIVRPGGMERPTDAYKETHNITLSEEDTLFGGLVSNLQVAELMAFMANNRGLSYCKVVEVIAETTAPLTPMDELLAKIPSQRAEPKEPQAADVPKPVPPKIVEPKAPSSPSQKEPAWAKAMVTRPLSPYTTYDDLKPPTSPTPTQPSSKKESASPLEAVSKPATPDTPPMPAPGVAETKPGPVETKTTRPLSPYAAYADLKPPTSPSPTAPVGSVIPKSATNAVPETGDRAPPMAATIDKQHHTEPNQKPLSPYPMYEDLKPPASPTPSLKL
ncbi:PREDICTED: protein TIC 62, chloroplastic-like isoform X2 [Populus euphratica]|uniref:Protein TIC 62, chloroplastic-like isoform X2 n=1 Tax=Populus euphratica TaxID=75702 RepID=A0AAJ6Y028_POPEU|nr:PREDICTED: protein TIC 62, chloroplastic-like isoform X2 [Populus euphratica]